MHALCSTGTAQYYTAHLILATVLRALKCAVLKHSIDHKVETRRSWLLERVSHPTTVRAGEGKGKTWEGMLTLWDERTHHVVVHATIL